ncbi:MAG: hypothetical protein ACEQSA_04935 [Weeksellaceae bacterium]
MSAESPQLFWIEQLRTETSFHMELKGRLSSVLSRINTESPFALPVNHIELAAGIKPLLESLVTDQLLAGIPAQVILSDFSYADRDVALNAFKSLQTPLNHENFYRSTADKIRLERHLRQDSQGVPRVQIPEDWHDVHLSFASLANYVAWPDLQQYIQHPSVRMISFMNSVSAGPQAYFHEQRVTSSEEIAAFIQQVGFIPSYEGMMTDLRNPEKPRFEPVIGGVYVRPENEDQAVWLHNNYMQQTIPVYQ